MLMIKNFKINYPINFKDTNFNLYDNRNKFCCILSSNKIYLNIQKNQDIQKELG